MFLCKKCHDKTKCKFPHIVKSFGTCGKCKERTLCYLCKEVNNAKDDNSS